MVSPRKKDMIPIHILAKYYPPTIAIHYKLRCSTKQYIHEIPITLTQSTQSIYDQIITTEKAYIDGRAIPKTKVPTSLDYCTHRQNQNQFIAGLLQQLCLKWLKQENGKVKITNNKLHSKREGKGIIIINDYSGNI